MFFSQNSQAMVKGIDLSLVIRKQADRLTVSVLPKSESLKDGTRNNIVPLIVSGYPAELDAGFFASAFRPLQRVEGLITNIVQFERQAEKAASESKQVKGRTGNKAGNETKEEPEKRDLCIEDLVKILNAETVPGKRMQLARDVLALSIYMLAMNTADLFGADVELEDDRIIYNRQKTANRRKDEALKSVKIEPEALSLIEQYRDPDKRRLFSFYKMYANFRDFNHNVNAGCKQLAAHLGIDVPLSTYYMRHTWATLASEECGISETDIALALNHVGVASGFESGKSLKTTRGYIHRRFPRNDTNNRIVLDYVKCKY